MITSVTPFRDTFAVATDDKVYLYLDGALTPIRFRDEDVTRKRQISDLRSALERIVEIETQNCIDYHQDGTKFEDPSEVLAIARDALALAAIQEDPPKP